MPCNRQRRCTTLGQRPSNFKLVVSPAFKFIQTYLIRQGFRDGFEGLIICKTSAYYTLPKIHVLKTHHQGKDHLMIRFIKLTLT